MESDRHGLSETLRERLCLAICARAEVICQSADSVRPEAAVTAAVELQVLAAFKAPETGDHNECSATHSIIESTHSTSRVGNSLHCYQHVWNATQAFFNTTSSESLNGKAPRLAVQAEKRLIHLPHTLCPWYTVYAVHTKRVLVLKGVCKQVKQMLHA
jgi:hypothetical protein